MLDKDHIYSQFASKQTKNLFLITSILAFISVLLLIFSSWYWGLVIILIVVFWKFYDKNQKSYPVYDLTDKKMIEVDGNAWRKFKKENPGSIAPKGKKEI